MIIRAMAMALVDIGGLLYANLAKGQRLPSDATSRMVCGHPPAADFTSSRRSTAKMISKAP